VRDEVPTHVAQREDRAGLARGDWTLIARIIHEEFAGEDHAVVEYEPSRRRLPNNAEQRDDAPGRREARDRRARRRARGAGGAISDLHGDDCARDTRARSGERARTLSAAAVAFVIRTSTAAPSPARSLGRALASPDALPPRRDAASRRAAARSRSPAPARAVGLPASVSQNM
jgi:hypothetical protein